MNHRNDSSDSLNMQEDDPLRWDRIDSDEFIAEYNKRFPAAPAHGATRVSIPYIRITRLFPHQVKNLVDPIASSSTIDARIFGQFCSIRYINRDIQPYYVFRADGTLIKVIHPTDGCHHSARGTLTIDVCRSTDPVSDNDLRQSLGIKDKDHVETTCIRGSLEVYDGARFNDIVYKGGCLYIEDLKIFISKNPNENEFLMEDNSSRVLLRWISDKEKILNLDLSYKLVVFTNNECDIPDFYYTSDGKIMERAFALRSPFVPPGELRCRITSYSSEDAKPRIKVKTVSQSELCQQGGVVLDHTLVLGTETKTLKEWCIKTKHKLRTVTLAQSECDSFLEEDDDNSKESRETTADLKARISFLEKTVKFQKEVINKYKNRAKNALNKLGKPETASMRDACKELEYITQGEAEYESQKTWKDRAKDFSETAQGFYKGIDGLYKGIVAAIGLATLIGGLILKFRKSG